MVTHSTPARAVFFVSDGTAITAETLGSALLVSFPSVPLERHTIPFVDSPAAAAEAVALIAAARAGAPTAAAPDAPPLVFSTIRDLALRQQVAAAPAIVIDLLGGHLREVEAALGVSAQPGRGTVHSLGDLDRYHERMWAIEYAIEHDDGQSLRALDKADVILLAPSRCGKTPTSMYLALQHGLYVANYPLVEEDLESSELPRPVRDYRERCFGITTTVERLSRIRNERRPGSSYAEPSQCRWELRRATEIFAAHRVPVIDSSAKSVEEISTMILQTLKRNGGILSREVSKARHRPPEHAHDLMASRLSDRRIATTESPTEQGEGT